MRDYSYLERPKDAHGRFARAEGAAPEIKVRERPQAPRAEEGDRAVPVAEGVTLRDPEMHARWTWADEESKRAAIKVATRKREGYRAATAEDVKEVRDAYQAPDGTYRRGDTLLMVCPRAAVEEREAARRRESASLEHRQVEAIERGQGIEADSDSHRQRVRGRTRALE